MAKFAPPGWRREALEGASAGWPAGFVAGVSTFGVAFQILRVPSSLAEAIRVPSGLNATPRTAAVCPRSVNNSSPEVKSQIFTVRS